MAKLECIHFFMTRPPEAVELLIDHLRLSKEPPPQGDADSLPLATRRLLVKRLDLKGKLAAMQKAHKVLAAWRERIARAIQALAER